MKVLVTGASGHVGSHTTAALLARGASVRALARDADRVRAALGPFGCAADVEVVAGDMVDVDAVAGAMQGCDAVVHTAVVGMPGRPSGADVRTNVVGAHAVLDAAAARGVQRVVYTSSFAAHIPTALDVLGPEAPLAEPTTPYSRAKHEIELLMRRRAAEGMPITTLALGGVYGPPSPHPEQSFTAFVGALASGMMVVPPAGNPVIDARDAAQIVAAAALSTIGGSLHLMAGGTFVSWADWVALLSETAGRDIAPIELGVDDLIAMGRDADAAVANGTAEEAALTEEAATIMACARPTDDAPTHALFGTSYRPLRETFADTVEFLRTVGLLDDA